MHSPQTDKQNLKIDAFEYIWIANLSTYWIVMTDGKLWLMRC